MQIDKQGRGFAAPLIVHPDTPAARIEAITCHVVVSPVGLWQLVYRIDDPAAALRLPPPAPPVATDGLWQTTCAELFVSRSGDAGYQEYNFAPSGAWAAYDFGRYREGMVPLAITPPQIGLSTDASMAELSVAIEGIASPRRGLWHIGLSMVIEEICGTKSYWALRHPPGKPDFHHRHCFARQLPPPERA